METLKSKILSDWSLIRIIRLLLAIFIAAQAFQTGSILLGLLSVFVLYQVISNTTCCGSAGCSIDSKKSKNNTNAGE